MIRDFLKDKFSTGSSYAIETFIFLYFNDDQSFPDRVIWENIQDRIETLGKTPERTLSTEIRKYTDNSPQHLTVSHPKLFTITNLGETPQRFKIIENI